MGEPLRPEASSCAEVTGACEDAQLLPSATIDCLFDYGVDSCEREGRYLVRCWGSPARDADHNWIRTLDCEAYGATCVDGACELGDCRFGAHDEGATCTGDTVALCGGRVVLASCGSTCGAASLPGEVSTSWCGPSVTVGSAAPADCDEPPCASPRWRDATSSSIASPPATRAATWRAAFPDRDVGEPSHDDEPRAERESRLAVHHDEGAPLHRGWSVDVERDHAIPFLRSAERRF